MNSLHSLLNQIESATGLGTWLTNSKQTSQRRLPTKFLAIDWTGSLLAVTEVARQGSDYIAGRTFRQVFPATESHSRERISEWLVALVRNEQLHALEVVVAAPRRFVAFKTLTLPNVHDDRLADAVACQAETVFPIAGHELAIDFIARPYDPVQAERGVLIAAIPRVHLELIEQVMSAAGLRTLAVVVSELGLGANGHSDADTTSPPNMAVISMNGAKIEFLIKSHGDPVLCYAAKAPEPTSLVAEIGTTLHRLVASIPRGVLKGPLTHLHLIGREAATIQSELRRIPGIALTIEATEASEEQVKLASITAAFEQAACRIDFHNPRRSVDPKQSRRQQRVRWAGMAMAIVALCSLAGWLNSLRVQQRIASLQSEVNRLQQLADQRRPVWESVAAVSRWQDRRIDWSQVLVRYLQSLPGNEQLMLKSLELSSAGAGTIDVEALARSGPEVHQLIDQFIASSEFCKTQLKRLELKAGDSRYSAEFTLGVSLAGGNTHAQ